MLFLTPSLCLYCILYKCLLYHITVLCDYSLGDYLNCVGTDEAMGILMIYPQNDSAIPYQTVEWMNE